jgi:hypothetical protein
MEHERNIVQAIDDQFWMATSQRVPYCRGVMEMDETETPKIGP